MLDVLSYPVSALMWQWHHLLSLVLDPDSGITWSLSVALLVITVRAVLFVPALKQFRSMRRSRELQAQIVALRTKHSRNSQHSSEQLRRLHHDQAAGLMGGCLPGLVQALPFIGLYHVLTNFSRSGMSVEQSSHLPNGVFDAAEVSSFLHARLCGAPLPAYLTMPSQALHSLGASLGRADIALVALPLLMLAGLATYLTARHSMRQQVTVTGPAAALSRVFPWLAALFPVLGGVFFPFPIAIALYWVTSNAWSLAQNYLLTRRFDAQDAARESAQTTVGPHSAPKPGQKPKRT